MSGRIHLWSCLVMHFVENVFTDSVPLLLFGLSIFSFSFSLGRLVCLQEFIHFYQVIHFIGVRLFVVVFYDLFLIFVSVVASLSFDFFYLCLVFFFFFDESSYQFSSVAQSCPMLYYPMNRSMSGFPVHHQLPELSVYQIYLLFKEADLSFSDLFYLFF